MTDRLTLLVDSAGALDLLALYRHLDDLAAEENAADTVIGRPQVLRERLLQLRDAVGSIKVVSKQAGQIDRLTRELAELKADRDSWIEQASARAQETVEAMQQVEAYRLRCEALHSAPREPREPLTDEQCDCRACINTRGDSFAGVPRLLTEMIVCPQCGNKRCPHAENHRSACTGSNEPEQVGRAHGIGADADNVGGVAHAPQR